MLDENAVPIRERYLSLEGHAAPSLIGELGATLSQPQSTTTVCCFVGRAYADLPLGKTFDRLFSRADYLRSNQTRCVVTAVTQQFFKPFTEIPHGWKTICWFDFPGDLPELIKDLPVIEAWYESTRDAHLLLSSEATWRALHGIDKVARKD